MMKNKTTLLAACLIGLSGLFLTNAFAYEYETGDFNFKLSGYGTYAAINPDFDLNQVVSMNDWRIRGSATYDFTDSNKLGVVYALDALALNQDQYSRDMFMFLENETYGRIEVGLTDSVVTKFGVAIPDVGGLRINDNPIFYSKLPPKGSVISNTILASGRYNLRANIMTVPTNHVQFGASIAGLSDQYDYAADFGIKYRQSEGKTKSAFSIGASFIDAPENLYTDIYSSKVTADWRAQASAGLNLSYNSWVFGMSGRIIYDSNPIGLASSDGVTFGTGLSYDVLKYSISGSYIMSSTGIWDNKSDTYNSHTGVLSVRYKYSENVDGWVSTGLSTDTPFLAAGLRLTF